MATQIYIDRNGERFGPYSIEEVNAHLAGGSLFASDAAWTEGMPAWLPIGQISGVIIPGSSAAPLTAPPAANPTCPNCHATLEPSQVICMGCGTNLETGKATKTKSPRKNLFGPVKTLLSHCRMTGRLAVILLLGFSVIYFIWSLKKEGKASDARAKTEAKKK